MEDCILWPTMEDSIRVKLLYYTYSSGKGIGCKRLPRIYRQSSYCDLENDKTDFKRCKKN